MAKEEFNEKATRVDDLVDYSTTKMQRGARELCKLMARGQGETGGEFLSKLIWQEAERWIGPKEIRKILNRSIDEVPTIEETPDLKPK